MASEPQARFLRDYQDQAVQSIIESVDNGKLSPLVVLPTSMGKTYLAIEAYRRLKDLGKVTKKLLWVVQSRELLEQTERSFKSAFPDLKIGYEQGSNKSSLDDDIIISMIQTLKNDRMENLFYSKEGRVGMLVVDEAHHAAAPTYRDLISTFQRVNPQGVLLGITATPDRSDAKNIRDIFDITYEMSLNKAIDTAWQPNLNLWTVRTTSDLSDVKVRGDKFKSTSYGGRGDYVEASLSHAVNTLNRNAGVVSSYINLQKHIGRAPHSIVFGADVAHAKDLAAAFIHEGFSAVAIDGAMDIKERKRLVSDFRDGKIKVLCNCNCATEGFDVPTLDAVFLARPTRSKLILTQQMGRGTRLHPDISNKISSCTSIEERQKLISSSKKSSVHIIDFVDIIGNLDEEHSPLQASDILGIPRMMANNGLEVQRTRKLLDAAVTLGIDIRTARDIKDIYIEMRVAKVMSSKIDKNRFAEFTKLSVIALSDGSIILPVPIKDGEVYHIDRTLTNNWQISCISRDGEVNKVGNPSSTLLGSFTYLEKYLEKHPKFNLLMRDANWRSENITENQQKFFIRLDREVPKNRGLAYDEILAVNSEKMLLGTKERIFTKSSLSEVNMIKDYGVRTTPIKPLITPPKRLLQKSITRGQAYILMNRLGYEKDNLPKTFDGAHQILSKSARQSSFSRRNSY